MEFSLLILILSCHALLRDASTDAILDEDAAINLPFVDVAFGYPSYTTVTASVAFFAIPSWNYPPPLLSLASGRVTAWSASLPAENQTWSVAQPESY